MFTGIVQAVGAIRRVVPQDAGVRLSVDAGGLDLADVKIGDSIAINGACMTVVRLAEGAFDVDVSHESLACTCGLDTEGEVNLERAMRLSDRLDGHPVSGHVDGTGEVAAVVPVGESTEMTFRAPQNLLRFIAPKGSITVNGVSLTVNGADGDTFRVNLIPHTLAVTTLRHLAPGSRVNLEVDMMARYIERLLAARGI